MTDLAYLKKYGNPDTFIEDQHRLEQGEPVQYLVGNVDFYGNSIDVTPDVLIPRFETEELIYQLTELLKKKNRYPKTILDLGTGSGCIAITLKKLYPQALVYAVDISKEALSLASKNALKNQVEIIWIESDFLNQVTGLFDVVISNPPYISKSEVIEEKVEKYEPSLALFAKENGLACYDTILKNIDPYIHAQSIIAFEIGMTQGEALKQMVYTYLPDRKAMIKKDLHKKDRFLYIE